VRETPTAIFTLYEKEYTSLCKTIYSQRENKKQLRGIVNP
jgi:hypothetical protein